MDKKRMQTHNYLFLKKKFSPFSHLFTKNRYTTKKMHYLNSTTSLCTSSYKQHEKKTTTTHEKKNESQPNLTN